MSRTFMRSCRLSISALQALDVAEPRAGLHGRDLAEDLLDVVQHGLGAGHRALVRIEEEGPPRQQLAAAARLGLDVHPSLGPLAVARGGRHRGQHVLRFVQVARRLLAGDVALEPVERPRPRPRG